MICINEMEETAIVPFKTELFFNLKLDYFFTFLEVWNVFSLFFVSFLLSSTAKSIRDSNIFYSTNV